MIAAWSCPVAHACRKRLQTLAAWEGVRRRGAAGEPAVRETVGLTGLVVKGFAAVGDLPLAPRRPPAGFFA